VLSKKVTRSSLFIQTVAVTSAFIVNYFLSEGAMFRVSGLHWNTYAIPYFIMLGLLAGLNSAYLTKSVILIKKISVGSNNEKLRILFGALTIGLLLFIFPSLYGEGYRTIQEFINHSNSVKISNALIAGFCAVLFLKPIVTSITLSIGGDGGIFAPRVFIGAVLGLVVSLVLNYFFNADVIILNFILVGMAAVLSSSIHAPLTAIFLICGLTSNYDLLFPLFITCFISKFIAAKIIPYTVYSYSGQ
jgi:CIC family chloride channel protein